MSIRYKHILVFIVFIILGSIISIQHGQGADWDTLNYHLYLPWAFFNNRLDIDFCPCGIQSYFNPIGMLPYYLLVEHFNSHPILVAIIQGWIWSCLGFLVYLISYEFLKLKTANQRVFLSIMASIIGVTIMPIYVQIGLGCTGLSSFIPVLLGIYLLIKNTESNKFLFLASFFIGISFGIKLTNGIYVLAIILAMSSYYFFNKKLSFSQISKKFLIYVLGSILGFLLINGYFMCLLNDKFNNPFFPFYNNIFNSELYTPVLYKDARYQPNNIWELLFFPIINIFQYIDGNEAYNKFREFAVADFPLYDMSLGMQYVGAIFLLFFKKIPFFKNKEITLIDFSKFNILIYLYFFSYFIWIVKFSIIRYFFATLVFAGLFLIVLFFVIAELSKKYKLCIFIFLLLIGLIFGTKYSFCNHPRIHFTEKILEVPDFKFQDNSVVVFGSKLVSYIALTQNKNVRYVGYKIDADGDNSLLPTEKYYKQAYSIMNGAKKVYVLKARVAQDGIIEEINENLIPELKLKGDCVLIQPNVVHHTSVTEGKFDLFLCE